MVYERVIRLVDYAALFFTSALVSMTSSRGARSGRERDSREVDRARSTPERARCLHDDAWPTLCRVVDGLRVSLRHEAEVLPLARIATGGSRAPTGLAAVLAARAEPGPFGAEPAG